jgi:hypothetical protein
MATSLLRLVLTISFLLLPNLIRSKDNENTTSRMYIVLDNSFSRQKEKKESYRRAVQIIRKHYPKQLSFHLTNSEKLIGIPTSKRLKHRLKSKMQHQR